MWLLTSPFLVARLCFVMQNIEEQALATYTRTIPLWLRYVDDTFTAVHKDGIDDFHEHLNIQNADIQFIKEIEENGKIPFLDCLVTRDNNKLQTTIYRKPTHTDRLLDQYSYNPTSHKATTIRTLTRRAQLVCDSPDSLQGETDYLNNVFSKNNYNTDCVRRNTHSNTDSNTQTKVNSGSVTTATLPYIRGTSELLHVYYKLTIYVLHINPWPLYDVCLLMSRTKTNRRTDREQYTRSNAATARLLTLVKPAETLARDWPNTNERRGMVMSTITLLSIIYRQNIKLTGTLRHV